ncbi:ABC-2 type transport system permease protein [Saccharopolyspora antimicrobica]|uniref:ABC-2 type transport system permease protein n=1 Tax=Saccharopolyspora antimicrobica TaxID=455193 RepID=A0A1I5CDF7_9PSEU|nr:polyketide antibiotic transporter [Saccharopolyspora antimicrobica]RKT88901.1 ABC-2 type transport system permease protein [Saccharopolyspora antimicrobica]SFN84681.1 ABC-2 type transport system permease protein [Saccharopolyspora antimicrobica]
MNAGAPVLVRLALRRERGIAPWWILLLVVLALVLVSYITRAMPTPERMAEYAELINRNSFFRALGGGFVVPDLGYLAAWRSGGFLYAFSALAAVLAVVRHTRADEDAGRIELLRAGTVGRCAPLTAALLVAGGVSLAGGGATAIALIGIGMEPAGSLAYGAAVSAAGWLFGAIGAVFAQLTRTARTARALGLYVLGAAYVLRYAGDASGLLWMKWASPLGWIHAVEPYWNDRWWMLAIPLSVSAVLVVTAYRLADRRDLGAGMLPERRGPAAAPGLRGPISLAWRFQRDLLLKWGIAIAVAAAGAGGVSTMLNQWTQAPGVTTDNLLRAFGGSPGAGLVDFGLWAMILIFAHVIALYPVLVVQRMRAEERSGRAELVQSTTLTRTRWAAGHLVVLGINTAVLLAVAGGVFGTLFAVLVGDPASDIPRVLAATLGTLPAVWLVGAICMLAYGAVPRASTALAWAVWTAVAVLGRAAGPLYGNWGGSPLEPFHHIPNTLAGAPFDPAPALVMAVLSALLIGTGLVALRRRDFG